MSEQQFAEELLSALGIEPSANNVSWIQQWIASEGPYGTQTGPLNIFPLGNTYNPQAVAAWLNTNGNFGGIGTYAQNIASYLNGKTSNIGPSLAWFSGQKGNAFNLTASYQKLVGSGAGAGTGYAADSGSTTGQNTSANTGAVDQGPSFFAPLTNALESGGLLIAAALLIGIGGLWLVLSNPNTQNTLKETAKAAVVAG